MGKYFGTDGIRGYVNKSLDGALAFKAGCAAAAVFMRGGVPRPRAVIGKDTRASGDMLEAALAAGLCSSGADVTLLGVLPTPAVAYLTVEMGADMGIVISASHNPYEHNGIKIFGADGFKLSDTMEAEIERLIDEPSGVEKKTGGDLGRIMSGHNSGENDYVSHLASMSDSRFSGRIAVDCANGAAYDTARALFTKLNVDFTIINDTPNGVNINHNCGSTHISGLCDIMRVGRFDIGFAFDGDADRCIAVDESGGVVDGDMMLAILARGMKASGVLRGGAVGTVVSNSGMEVFAGTNGFNFFRADVGDRNVLELMIKNGCNLGGESSGHMIFLDDATTGDGQLTAIKMLNALESSGKALSELAGDIPRFPHVMLSHRLTGGKAERDIIMAHPRILEEIKKQESLLLGEGRVLVRPSGTEAVIRVLFEARTEKIARQKAEDMINLMKSL